MPETRANYSDILSSTIAKPSVKIYNEADVHVCSLPLDLFDVAGRQHGIPHEVEPVSDDQLPTMKTWWFLLELLCHIGVELIWCDPGAFSELKQHLAAAPAVLVTRTERLPVNLDNEVQPGEYGIHATFGRFIARA